MTTQPSVTVVIPCLDEAEALPGVLAKMPAEYRKLVVDNGSEDETAAVARAGGADVVCEPHRGYGAAVQAGICAATSEIVAVLDGDGSLDPRELPPMVEKLYSGVDLVVGRRRPVGRAAWPWYARTGNRLVAARLRRRHGLPVHDIGSMRVARRADLLALGALHPGSGYPLQLLVRAARAGWTVAEYDTTYRPRAGGVSKVSGSLRGALGAARAFWAVGR